ncbi:MAG: B12-binding domain-containing radical SAM protein [Firmicutes bacterium]|nr:B12-binding domain-containing radical SAM protein [Bacillota bacterium]
MKTAIVSIGAKNIHKTLAAWCIKSYCQSNGQDVEILEVNINDSINEIVGKVFKSDPQIVGFSCYIWNIDCIAKIGGILKKLIPNIVVVLGGPEVFFEKDLSAFPFADFIIRGAGEKAFYDLILSLNQNGLDNTKNAKKSNSKKIEGQSNQIIDGCIGGFDTYPSPYTKEYFDSFALNQIPSIKNQLVYYESSRGCPFFCSYCLSSTFSGVQYLPLDRVKSDLNLLIKNEAKCIKFVDRTFNSDKKRAANILDFIASLDTDCVFHFEAAADLFDQNLLNSVKNMPLNRIQFEIGIQSTNNLTLNAIGRQTDLSLVFKNISTLLSYQNCHIHVDLIAGLPLETFETFKAAIDQCINLKPHVLQIGFLKMLKGTPIRDKNDFGAVFCDHAPYEVYQTDTLKFDQIIELKQIENITERFFNNSAFLNTVDFGIKNSTNPYDFFKNLSDFCAKDSFNFKVSMKNAYQILYDFLIGFCDKRQVKHHIKMDCLSFDKRGLLPDCIEQNRNKQAEIAYKKQTKTLVPFRIEFFELDGKHRLFVYDTKHPILNKYIPTIFDI